MDYHWDEKSAVIILDDEMSEFELSDAQSERKLVEYVIGITFHFLIIKELSALWLLIKLFNWQLLKSFITILRQTWVAVLEYKKMDLRDRVNLRDSNLTVICLETFLIT